MRACAHSGNVVIAFQRLPALPIDVIGSALELACERLVRKRGFTFHTP